MCGYIQTMRIHPFLSAVLVLCLPVAGAAAAERVCEQSESTVTPAPGGQLAASVQHQVCETNTGGVSAAVTVFVGDAAAPQRGTRVLATAVPRSREEWPLAVWRSDALLEVWVPNFAQVLETRAAHEGVTVQLKYCHDDPQARARVAQHEADMKQWMQAVTRWVDARNTDPEAAGPRPPRPEEPRFVRRACTEADIRP